LGGGNGEHLNFVKHDFNKNVLFDAGESNLKGEWGNDPRIQTLVGDAEDVPFPNQTFDGIIITFLLHHVNNPKKVFL
jgi:ubiquinone/menaquinone biosynthesis C-methylase UbiE